ncbi:hypothetical protein H311_03985, partial [Anncaliia algerae PRA109]
MLILILSLYIDIILGSTRSGGHLNLSSELENAKNYPKPNILHSTNVRNFGKNTPQSNGGENSVMKDRNNSRNPNSAKENSDTNISRNDSGDKNPTHPRNINPPLPNNNIKDKRLNDKIENQRGNQRKNGPWNPGTSFPNPKNSQNSDKGPIPGGAQESKDLGTSGSIPNNKGMGDSLLAKAIKE